ncbi:MAG TPA: hypothetical protein VL752_15725 [Acidisoma sp.]|uniref:hypothetical protein n=1 Tax=Acidisoma sp. TaxID=1872115 RepID=UPI002C83DEE4|nr:hypothetical protein [Acidisoma sp.]HTI02398.1 hypothetical protein [Acidisoma sp.]
MEADVPGPASPPDPAQDHPARTLPHNIAVLLQAIGILLNYGRHLIDTVRQRATVPNFNAIAACFGTANLATILAHLNRGILRAQALERMLRARAAIDRDIDFVERRTRAPQPQPAPATEPEQPAATPPAPRKRAFRPAACDDPELFMPTEQDLDRQVRRRPIGRTIFDICSDLAVVPAFCHSGFWNTLFEAMHFFGGSVTRLMQEKTARRDAFIRQQDRIIGSNWDWVNLSRDALRAVLGFFIGEPPVNPFAPDAAPATGPP